MKYILISLYEPVYVASLKTLCFANVNEPDRINGGTFPITRCKLHFMVFCRACNHSLRSEGVGVYNTKLSSGAVIDIAF